MVVSLPHIKALCQWCWCLCFRAIWTQTWTFTRSGLVTCSCILTCCLFLTWSRHKQPHLIFTFCYSRRKPQTSNWVYKMSDCVGLLDVWKLWMQNTHTYTQHDFVNLSVTILILPLSVCPPAENWHQTHLTLYQEVNSIPAQEMKQIEEERRGEEEVQPETLHPHSDNLSTVSCVKYFILE